MNATEMYVMKVAPTYTATMYHTATGHTAFLDEWAGRSAEDFNAGMKGRGFRYRKDEYTLSSGKFVEHIWER